MEFLPCEDLHHPTRQTCSFLHMRTRAFVLVPPPQNQNKVGTRSCSWASLIVSSAQYTSQSCVRLASILFERSKISFATMVRAVSMSALLPGVLGLSAELYVKGYEIEGLRTKFVAYRERTVHEVNRTLASVEVKQPDGSPLLVCSVGVVGSMSLNNLGELLTGELQANGVRPVAFSADGIVLPEGCLFSFVNKQFPSDNGFISLVCLTEKLEGEEEDAVDGGY